MEILKERYSDYGDPVEMFDSISKIASIMVGKDLNPEECCKFMMAMKIARELYKHKEDNLVDYKGYAKILELIKEKEAMPNIAFVDNIK